MTDIYTPAINTFIEQIKGDKSIVQPYRNYALKHLHEALAEIHEGQRVTNQEPPEYMVDDGPQDPARALEVLKEAASCTCPEGGVKQACPVHGWA